MDRILKFLKVAALLTLIVFLLVLSVPTLRGPFVITHFATTLAAWIALQVVFLGLALAANLVARHRLHRVTAMAVGEIGGCGSAAAYLPLRC